MAHQVILTAQLVPRFYTIESYAVLQSIPCSPECKIVGKILPDHPLSYALTATADVPTVGYVPRHFYFLVETPENPFVAPVNIETIEAFMNRVGYQGVVDKKKEAIQYPRFIKLIIADLMKKFPNIPQRIEEDYYSIKDDIPLGNKRKQSVGESSSPQNSLKITTRQHKVVEGDKDDDSENWPEPKSHKENPEHIDDDDDDDKDEDKVDEDEGVEMGSLETRTEDMQTPILTPPRSLRTILSSDKNITQELTDTGVSQLEEKDTEDLIENNLKPCIAATIIEERDAFRSEEPDLVSQEFNAQAPKIIEDLFKNYIQSNVIQVHPTTTTSTETTSLTYLQQQLYFKMKRSLQDRVNDPTLWEVLKHKFEKSLTSNTSCRDDDIHFQRHDDHQEDDAPPEGEKIHLAKDSKTYVSKQQQQQHEWDAWVEETSTDEDEVIPKDETPKLITKLQDVDKSVLTIYDYARMKATLNDTLKRFSEVDLEEKTNRWVRKEFNTFNEDAWITEVVRITTDQPHGLDFMEQIIMMRENDKLDSFSEANFKYQNKNNIEDLYYLCQNNKVNYRETKLINSLIKFIKSRVIWERVHDFQLRIKSYQIKVNLTAPTLTFPSIEEHQPYSIVDKPSISLIYLNNKDEKRVMYLVKIVKFYDATLEKVLKEVKLKIFQSEPWRKPYLLEALIVGIKASRGLLSLSFEVEQGEVVGLVVHVDPEDSEGGISWWLVMGKGNGDEYKLHGEDSNDETKEENWLYNL
nr:mediator of RNA polymerase II transcription subunit 17 [Tanacetum cinerariifolium]